MTDTQNGSIDARPCQFALSSEALNSAAFREMLFSTGAGAFCSFEGWVREENEGRRVVELAFTTYPQLAEKVGSRMVATAIESFDLRGAILRHRVGALRLGDLAVWIGATAAHRESAFAGCRWLIEEVKRDLPIWKRESYADGSHSWVNHA